ncbi:interleukin beta [Labeo rohita]|uniref:Interleukin-1 beta n=1 Tax=Labeo rohita TaxID=84645 RepID=A0A498NR66_LABRO|nr:interleukin beta [Labeo rohita]RXN34037.1 interleukin beta [Labeo rohita]
MASEGSPVCGGVLLLHTECGGKHSYEVNGFLNYNKGMFASAGDKLIMVNNTDVEDLTPKALAELLVERSPLLTIHHPHKRKTEECESEEISVYDKKPIVMRFSLMMVREEDLDAAGDEPSPDWEYIEDDCLSDNNLLLVSMADTCFNSSRILRQIREQKNLYLKSFIMKQYVTPDNQHMLLKDTMSAKITLYYYADNMGRNGVPVVLNFTGTENFFCCTTKQDEDKKMLKLVTYDRTKIMACEDDEKSSLIFYMVQKYDGLRYFESVRYRGWYIHTINENAVKMEEGNSSASCSFVLE